MLRSIDTEDMLVACHDCGAVHVLPGLPEGSAAACLRCDSHLVGHRTRSVHRALALNLAALALFLVANVFPLMTMTMTGISETTTLLKGVTALGAAGLWELAAVVGLVAIVFPFVKIMASLYVLLRARIGGLSRTVGPTFRLAQALRPWSMTEVYLLGLIVAYVKLKDLASIELGPALFALIGLILTMIWAESSLEPHEIWERIAPQRRFREGDADRSRQWLRCHACAQLTARDEVAGEEHPACPRCSAALHDRRPQSLARTWALLSAAAILYIPANILPVMTVVSLGQGEADTILSGVKVLIEAGMFPIAALVFFASITVPVLKLMGLSYLLVSTQRGAVGRLRERTRIYRIIEQVGRWSMVDIFMISILVALVDLGELARIEPGFGAVAFASVVILTMLASHSFDPRLMWDAAERVGGPDMAPTGRGSGGRIEVAHVERA